MMPEQREKKDDRERNSQQPKKCASTKAHNGLHNCLPELETNLSPLGSATRRQVGSTIGAEATRDPTQALDTPMRYSGVIIATMPLLGSRVGGTEVSPWCFRALGQNDARS
jgi:hypothetical protein